MTEGRRWQRTASNAVLAVLVLFALAAVVSAASPFWSVPGTLGFTSDYGGTVRAVAADGPAARAGLAVGDHLRLRDTPFDERRYVAGVPYPIEAGRVVHIGVVRGAETHRIA